MLRSKLKCTEPTLTSDFSTTEEVNISLFKIYIRIEYFFVFASSKLQVNYPSVLGVVFFVFKLQLKFYLLLINLQIILSFKDKKERKY